MADGGLLNLDAPRRTVTDPLADLLATAGDCLQLVDSLRSVVGRLDRVATDPTSSYGSTLAPEISAYLMALRQAERTLTNIIKSGVAERQAALDEKRVEVVVAVIRGSLHALGVNAHDDTVRQTVARQLKLAAALS